MKRSILLSVILIMGIGFTSASDTPTEGVWNFRNYTAKTAKSRYDFETGKAKRDYDTAVERLLLTRVGVVQKARVELLSQLDEALLFETKAGRLDEAIKIKRAIEEVKSGKGIPGREERPTKKNIPSCAIEWNGHHYLAVLMPVDWEKAKKLCEEMGGHLVYIEDEREMKMLSVLTKDIYVWVGGTNLFPNSQWQWANGQKIKEPMWDKSQPSNPDIEHYTMLRQGKLGDFPRQHRSNYGFICEWDQ